jgi:hypothetical protein
LCAGGRGGPGAGGLAARAAVVAVVAWTELVGKRARNQPTGGQSRARCWCAQSDARRAFVCELQSRRRGGTKSKPSSCCHKNNKPRGLLLTSGVTHRRLVAEQQQQQQQQASSWNGPAAVLGVLCGLVHLPVHLAHPPVIVAHHLLANPRTCVLEVQGLGREARQAARGLAARCGGTSSSAVRRVQRRGRHAGEEAAARPVRAAQPHSACGLACARPRAPRRCGAVARRRAVQLGGQVEVGPDPVRCGSPLAARCVS